MNNKLESIKKLTLSCFIFLAISINLIYAINIRMHSTSNSQVIKMVLAAGNQGNISISESSYFKKYIISCDREIEKLNLEDNKDYININLKKDEAESINLNGDKKLQDQDLGYNITKDGYILKIKKKLEHNNFVSIDRNNKKNIIILISKVDKPFTHSVVIDPGHGGVDKGANYGSLYEKDINLKIANYAADQLEFSGIKVILTRDEDKLLPLKEIGDITNSSLADIFVSVHVNENKESKYCGVSSYYYDPNGFQTEERIRLAKTMQSELVKSDSWKNVGILRQNFAVLRYSNIPSVLLECGFISNTEDRNKLTQDNVLRNYGDNIAKGVIKYFQKNNN
ncbi:N-acetylmuramoyl-L-alanine amidase family protein [Candidatus Clostridium radicumherbarum]|uniref:N-acetylmuramoyl-L-alanine amidase n=1 Tax=Candidatus Clostridium radicumherbarum TaxID=3381662 RepID=A0ABW8TPL0_9CLOT